MEILVPRPILNYMCEQSSVQYLPENKIKEIITHKNITYVITGYGSSGAEGYLYCNAKQIVPLEIYNGELKPLTYNECLIEMANNKRERGYNGQLVEYNGCKYVTLSGDYITFKPTNEGIQLDIFK